MNSQTTLLVSSLLLITAVGLWGIFEPESALSTSRALVEIFFESRGWFIMLTVTGLLFFSIAIAVLPVGKVRLGQDDDRPEFSTPAWLAMLFSAGMGVGLLFWAAAEPLTHFGVARDYLSEPNAASEALTTTLFHWGLHAWGIYTATALCIAYFTFRRGTPMLISAPLASLFPEERWAKVVGWLSDFMAISAIAIGVGGSIAMGVFQVANGIDILRNGTGADDALNNFVFAALVLCFLPPLMLDLGSGMSKLSNLAMLLAGVLLLFVVLFGPTQFLMNSVLSSFGSYISDAIPRGFQTFTFFDDGLNRWFKDWTLTYMVWWIAWGPFVGVFIARISKGRTIREFVIGVLLVPTAFSMIWFGAFGGIGIYDSLQGSGELVSTTEMDVNRVTFELLARLPFSKVTTVITILAAFLFIVTSVVSAAFVLGTFSTGGDPEPAPRIRLIWGVLLGLLGAAMIVSGSIDAVRSMIALGALPFVFILLLMVTCLARALKEDHHADR